MRTSPRVMQRWATETASPRPVPSAAEFAFCGEGDEALREVAQRLAQRELSNEAPLGGEELTDALRRAGDPHVWPHAWIAKIDNEDRDRARIALQGALGHDPEHGVRRCGVAEVRVDAATTLLAVTWVDALADLEPIPIEAPRPRWIGFTARLLEPASVGRLFVLPPGGVPFTVPTEVHGERARATFFADRQGTWRLQLVAAGPGGPRPLLEAIVFVGVGAPPSYERDGVPAEDVMAKFDDPTEALAAMVRTARRAHSLPLLERSTTLDRIATEHAASLLASQKLAHDAGDGDPSARLERSGVHARFVGENVAHEATAALSARALWQSVSHRANILDPRFRSMGVGVARDSDGSLWTAQLLVDSNENIIPPGPQKRDRSFADAPRD